MNVNLTPLSLRVSLAHSFRSKNVGVNRGLKRGEVLYNLVGLWGCI